MRLKELEGYLQQVRAFEEPKVLLEQYPTSAHIAAHLLYTIETVYGDIEDKVVCDLGVGCGVLSIGAVIMGAGQAIGFDIDHDALAIARKNADQFDIDNLDLVHVDIGGRKAGRLPPLPVHEVDTVIMNPPFGTKHNAGIDMNFLEQASKVRVCVSVGESECVCVCVCMNMGGWVNVRVEVGACRSPFSLPPSLSLLSVSLCQICTGAIYSLNKTSTRAFIRRKCKEFGLEMDVVAELRYDIPQMYKFHKKKSVRLFLLLLNARVDSRSSPPPPTKKKKISRGCALWFCSASQHDLEPFLRFAPGVPLTLNKQNTSCICNDRLMSRLTFFALFRPATRRISSAHQATPTASSQHSPCLLACLFACHPLAGF